MWLRSKVTESGSAHTDEQQLGPFAKFAHRKEGRGNSCSQRLSCTSMGGEPIPVFDDDSDSAERRAHVGIREGLSRCSKAITLGDVDKLYVAYAETMMWVRSLDEHFQIAVNDYEQRRQAHPGGQVVEALCWGGDKSIHQFVAFHDHAERSIGDIGHGPSFPDGSYPVWLASDRLPVPDSTFGNGNVVKVEAYDDCLASLPIWATLVAASDFLWSLARPGGGWVLLDGAEFIGNRE